MRISEAISAIEARLSGLVHDCAKNDPVERSRHERFIASRMTVGAIALCLLPLYLLVRGVPSGPEYVAMICLVAPVAAAIVLSRSGRLALAHAISSASLAGLVVCIAATSGGVSAGAAVWLVAVPLEALLSGSRRAALAASAIAGLSALFLAALEAAGIRPAVEPWPAAVAMPVFAITAIAHAATLAVEHCRVEMHRRTAARLRDASERSLLQAIDDLVTWHDRNGHVVKASAAATKLLGVPPSCLVGRGLLNRVHVSDRPAFLKAISDAALADRPVALEFRLHLEASEGREDRHPARVIWVETRAHRIDAEAGAAGAYAVVAVTRDVTDHKRRAEEFERARSDAEEADESKARFLATVSHELRTPLNAIIGFSEVVERELFGPLGNERYVSYVRDIRNSGEHLLSLINDILDLSKIEAGRFQLRMEEVDCNEIAHSVARLIRPRTLEHGLTMKIELPDRPV
ncbi:MAG: PAS domain-containing sensor histidine kinase, partial [Microvirga sp.]